jgi:hypothetical protein
VCDVLVVGVRSAPNVWRAAPIFAALVARNSDAPALTRHVLVLQAYGIVWKAIDKKTRETVALKKIFDAFQVMRGAAPSQIVVVARARFAPLHITLIVSNRYTHTC